MEVRRLGLVPYPKAWELQNQLAGRRRAGTIPDTLVLLQHPHTYTIGRRGTRDHVYLTEDELSTRGITCLEVDRGGDVTYHGPGQLVGYPILDLGSSPDVGAYLRGLEQCLIDVLRDFGITAGRMESYTGVWIGDEKIAAIGVKLAGGITTHGFALNVTTDLELFSHILPCGIPDKGVTSMERQLHREPSMSAVEDAVVTRLTAQFAGSGLKPARVA